jgi:predicted dehydrogenase
VGEPVSALRVGMVGAGHISGQYLATLARSPNLRLTAVTGPSRWISADR